LAQGGVGIGAVATLWRGSEIPRLDQLGAEPGRALVFASLGVSGLGGIVAALGLGIPGRRILVHLGLGAALLGLAAAAAIATALVVGSPVVDAPSAQSTHLRCIATAVLGAFLPASATVAYAGRAAVYRPLLAAVAAAAGTAALGAVLVEASCPLSTPLHLLLGHVTAPAVAVVLLTVPLLLVLRSIRR